MQIVTFTPIHTSLRLQPGLDPRSRDYQQVLSAMPADDEQLCVPNRELNSRLSDFDRKDEDNYDTRLVVYRQAVDRGEIVFHVFPVGMAIVEICLNYREHLDPRQVEEFAQRHARELMVTHLPAVSRLLADAATQIPDTYLDKQASETVQSLVDESWTARTVLIAKDSLPDPAMQTFLEQWLCDTARPDDAQRLIAGETDYSMTWLNYVIVDADPARTRMLRAAMRLSQYYYAVQHILNRQAQLNLSSAQFEKNARKAEAALTRTRKRMQMLQIQFGVQKSFMNRTMRRVVDGIMQAWEFDDVVANGNRLIEASSARINELDRSRREFSTYLTDVILAAIALIAIMELSLGLVQYSREFISRPVLGYTDSGVSRVLSFVASREIDVLLSGSALLFVILVVVYGLLKRHK